MVTWSQNMTEKVLSISPQLNITTNRSKKLVRFIFHFSWKLCCKITASSYSVQVAIDKQNQWYIFNKVWLEVYRHVTRIFFMVGEFYWNYGTLINIYVHSKKERRRRKTNRWLQSGHCFSKVRALFFNFWKRAGKTSPSPSSSYAPGLFHQFDTAP